MAQEWDFTKSPAPKVRKALSKPVGGWRGGSNGHAVLSAKNRVLHVKTTGGDPQLVSGPLKVPAGKYVFSLRMNASAGGGGLLFTRSSKEGYRAGSGTPFSVKHDNNWHEISIPLERDHDISEIRLDPCTANGSLQIEWMRLTTADGKVVKEWKF